jgi:CheY-like chemotaxis protein/nitrogen-specific signal transduction histidine kinase
LIIDDLNKGEKARIDLAREKQITEDLINSRHQLLLSVSHEIKTPLSSMMGYMEMWDSDELPADIKRQLHSARNSGLHILSMLTNLLEFSRLETNKGVLHFSQFDLIELVNDIIDMFQPLTEEKGLKLQFENHTTSPFVVETDFTLIKQILINVISNAVKYTLQGSVIISLQYEQQLIFTITDTGIGIEKEDMKDIFKPFSRIKNPLKTEGNGFGMYVTKGLVDSLKGEITVASEKGKGTCVTIHLPVTRVILPEQETQEIQEETTDPDNHYGKILLFEDDAALGNMIREFLTQNGYKVKLCSNTRDVQGFIRLISSFDIVFTDMQMRDISGMDILREIRKKDVNIPVWLMTAYDEYTPELAVKEGFSGLIVKPIQMGRLLQILSGKKELKQSGVSLSGQFPQLTAMFNGDTKAVKEILSEFVQSSEKDREALKELIYSSRFREAQQLCHRMHPFYSQLDADYLCEPLRKMDRLRGED